MVDPGMIWFVTFICGGVSLVDPSARGSMVNGMGSKGGGYFSRHALTVGLEVTHMLNCCNYDRLNCSGSGLQAEGAISQKQ